MEMMTVPNPLESLLARAFPVPDPLEKRPLPAFLELSDGSFVPIERVSKAQLRATAKLHRLIAARHAGLADVLDGLAKGSVEISEGNPDA
jgi:hypothetical protein